MGKIVTDTAEHCGPVGDLGLQPPNRSTAPDINSKVRGQATVLVRLFSMVLLALLPGIAFQISNEIAAYHATVRHFEEATVREVELAAAEQAQPIAAAGEFLQALASLEPVMRQDGATCNAALTALAPHYPNYEFFGVVDRDGMRFCDSGVPFPGRTSLVDHSFFRLALRGPGLAIGGYRVSLVDQAPVLELGLPFFDHEGKLAGVAYAGLGLTHANEQMKERPMPQGSELIVADRAGLIIGSAPDRGWIGRKLPQEQQKFVDADRAGSASLPGLDGIERDFAYLPAGLPGNEGRYIAFGMNRQLGLAEINRSVWRGAGADIASVAIAFLVTWLFGKFVIRPPFLALLAATQRWQQGDWAARVPANKQAGEMGLIAGAFNGMADAVSREFAERAASEARLAKSNAEIVENGHALEAQAGKIALLATMAQRLQGCATETEFAEVVCCFAPQILPGIPGVLYVLSDSRNLLHAAATWNEPVGLSSEFGPSECWGLRRGHSHIIKDTQHDVVCGHVKPGVVSGYSCRPLVALGETIGLLYLEYAEPTQGQSTLDTARGKELDVFAENIALALANHRLRESLRSQSIRDSLTGLYNRRYLEEVLELDFARSSRDGEPLSLIMADLDHFKTFNDTFGHDAGDYVLKQFAQVLTAEVRKGDVACRYGGEEFVVLVRGADIATATARARDIRAATNSISTTFHGKPLGPVTVSLGVASFPEHARDGQELLAAADAALYAAKRGGRDQVQTATSMEAELSERLKRPDREIDIKRDQHIVALAS
jgi:diguanylate cyclase (GGDEF)-like protein